MKDFVTVRVKGGQLRGKTGTDYQNKKFFSFQGIPYAKPPLGDLRFKDPEPPEPWKGVRDATEEGSDCYARNIYLNSMVGSEDCLVLNVFTPKILHRNNPSNLKPVMVWIHGGGFTSGSSSAYIYGPEFLVSADVVLVTINYRTGILGFLSLEDTRLRVPGNAGLKDMVMALKWVKENIVNFYGDPKNVTIFGESAGAAAAHYLILSPMAKGLFHKAILQSGCALNVWAHGTRCAIDVVKAVGHQAGTEKEALDLLQKMPLEKLYKGALSIPDHFIASKLRPHGPVIEKPNNNAFLSMNPADVIKSGKYNHVPIIFGYTTREGILSEILQKPKPVKPITDFHLAIPHFLNLNPKSDIADLVAGKIKKFYYGNEEPTTKNLDKFFIMETDNFFFRDIIRTIKLHLETTKCPLYLYRMSVEGELNMMKMVFGMQYKGVCHADDLGYLFKNLVTPEIEPDSLEDLSVRRFVTLWSNFSRTGNPTYKKPDHLINVTWKPATTRSLNFIDIGEKLTVGCNPEADRRKFWDEILKISPVHKL